MENKDDNSEQLSESLDDALVMRGQVLKALEKRFLGKRLSERKGKDGSLEYKEVIARMEKEKEEVPIRYINKPGSKS